MAEETEPAEVTLAAVEDWVNRTIELVPPDTGNDHARGARNAALDVKTILDSRFRPPGAPIVFEHPEGGR